MKRITSQPCVLQHEDPNENTPCITAEETIRDGEKVVEILEYQLPFLDEGGDENDREIAERIALSMPAWATLVEMFCLRYPAAARHLMNRDVNAAKNILHTSLRAGHRTPTKGIPLL